MSLQQQHLVALTQDVIAATWRKKNEK